MKQGFQIRCFPNREPVFSSKEEKVSIGSGGQATVRDGCGQVSALGPGVGHRVVDLSRANGTGSHLASNDQNLSAVQEGTAVAITSLKNI